MPLFLRGPPGIFASGLPQKRHNSLTRCCTPLFFLPAAIFCSSTPCPPSPLWWQSVPSLAGLASHISLRRKTGASLFISPVRHRLLQLGRRSGATIAPLLHLFGRPGPLPFCRQAFSAAIPLPNPPKPLLFAPSPAPFSGLLFPMQPNARQRFPLISLRQQLAPFLAAQCLAPSRKTRHLSSRLSAHTLLSMAGPTEGWRPKAALW